MFSNKKTQILYTTTGVKRGTCPRTSVHRRETRSALIERQPKFAREILFVRISKGFFHVARNFQVIHREIGKSFDQALLGGVVVPRSLLSGRPAIRPIAIDWIHPPFFMRKNYVKWNDFLPVTKCNLR